MMLVLLSDVIGPGFAQDQATRTAQLLTPRQKNKIEDFVSRKGVLLVQMMYSIKSLSWSAAGDQRIVLAVSAMHAYEADQKNHEVFAVRFEAQPIEGIPVTSLLDLPSAQSLLTALERMIAQSKEDSSNPPEFLQVKFALGDSFECGFDQQGTLKRPYVVLGLEVSRTIRSHHMTDLEDLKEAVAMELEKLRELGAR
jgi:hypothetical protein